MNINLPKNSQIDNFNITEKLGEGHTGVVYLAYDEKNKRDVALKFLKKTGQDDDIIVDRFKNEYQKQLLGKSQVNISEVYQFGYFDDHFYIASEFIKGKDVYTATRKIPIKKKIDIFIEILRGLDFIHENGILHLDVKRGNVFLTNEGKIKIVDFGFASALQDNITRAGTPHYIAPEVALKWDDRIDARADLFSTAVLMYYCFTNTFPFDKRWKATDLKEAADIIANEPPPLPMTNLVKDIPEYLNTIILRLLAKDPKDRFYSNARAVINAIQTHETEVFGSFAVSKLYLRPIGDEHIGREELKADLKGSLERLNKNEQPEKSVYYIKGQHGFGKTHLLTKLKEIASVHAKNMFISEISFPTDEISLERWMDSLRHELSENERGILILADDVHERDNNFQNASLQNIIKTVMDRIANPKLNENLKPVMLVMMADEETSIDPSSSPVLENDRGVRIYELQPLSKSEVENYLRSTPAFKNRAIPVQWLENLYWSTSGIPSEIANELLERDSVGGLFSSLEGNIFVPETDEASITRTSWHGTPMATKDRLLKRYHKLGTLEKEVINFVSVWNYKHVTRPVTEEDVAEFFYSPSIRHILSELIDKNFLTRQLVFANPYMRSVVYEQLSQEDREAIHDTIANYLKDDEEGILLHKGYGASDRHVISLVKLTHLRIRQRGDINLAVELLSDASVITHAPLNTYIQTLLIECYSNAGKYAEAERIFNEAIKEDGIQALWKIQLYRKAIPALIQQHKFDETEVAIALALKLAGENVNPALISINNQKGRCLYEKFFAITGAADQPSASVVNVNFLEEAKKIYETNRELEKKVPEHNRSRIQNNELGTVLLVLGNYVNAVEILQEKLARHKKERNVFGEISTYIAIANAYHLLKDFKSAEKFAKDVLTLIKSTHQGLWRLTVHNLLANIYYDSKRYEDAILEANKCLASGQFFEKEKRWKIICNQMWVLLGHSHLELNALDKAVLYLEAAISAGVSGYHNALAHIGLCDVNIRKKDIEKANGHFLVAEKVIASLPEPQKNSVKSTMDEFRTTLKSGVLLG